MRKEFAYTCFANGAKILKHLGRSRDLAEPLAYLGLITDLHGDPSKARRLFRAALKLNPACKEAGT